MESRLHDSKLLFYMWLSECYGESSPFISLVWIYPENMEGDWYKFHDNSSTLQQLVKKVTVPAKSQIKQLLQAAVYFSLWQLWKSRNVLRQTIRSIEILVKGIEFLLSGTMDNSVHELTVMKKYNIVPRPNKSGNIVEVSSRNPPSNWTKANIDGASWEIHKELGVAQFSKNLGDCPKVHLQCRWV